MKTLTPRQQAILEFVVEHLAREGMPPTLAEIARAFGFNQVRAAQKHLLALAAKGQLELLPGKARGIRLPGRGDAPLRLPVLGRVAAGPPIGADADSGPETPRVSVDATLFAPSPHYLLRVRGDSMRDEGILDGDLLAVHHTPVADYGQIVVARLEDGITVKRLEREGDAIILRARNPDYAPIRVDETRDFAIIGIFCGLVRQA
jgi:repressor LexA